MEGNRHERVALLITSYIIGFVTAFIAYGLSSTSSENIKIVQVPETSTPNQTANVRTALEPDLTVYADGTGLKVSSRNDDTVLLSATANTYEYEEYVGMDGVHHDIPYYSLSPNSELVYFCEQSTPDSEMCKPFIYSIQEEVVYPVMQDGERVDFEIATHSVEWGSDGELVY